RAAHECRDVVTGGERLAAHVAAEGTGRAQHQDPRHTPGRDATVPPLVEQCRASQLPRSETASSSIADSHASRAFISSRPTRGVRPTLRTVTRSWASFLRKSVEHRLRIITVIVMNLA